MHESNSNSVSSVCIILLFLFNIIMLSGLFTYMDGINDDDDEIEI
jgi:hypothetical protein